MVLWELIGRVRRELGAGRLGRCGFRGRVGVYRDLE